MNKGQTGGGGGGGGQSMFQVISWNSSGK